jgi:hypothetical protein
MIHTSATHAVPTGKPRPRSGPRVTVNQRAVLILPKTGQPHPVLLRDVSTTGACVHGDVNLSVGDAIRLRIDIDKATKLIVPGFVTRVRQMSAPYFTEIGVRFGSIDGPSAQALSAYVSSRAPAHHA